MPTFADTVARSLEDALECLWAACLPCACVRVLSHPLTHPLDMCAATCVHARFRTPGSLAGNA
eukprot:365846-Chlamydomonas_euryale.AAC.8